MTRIYIFILRTILSVAFAIILTRMFHPEKSIAFMAGIAVILLTMSYFLAYLRGKGSKENKQ